MNTVVPEQAEERSEQQPLFEIENLAKSHIQIVKDRKLELKGIREDLKDALAEIDEFSTVDLKAKDAVRERGEVLKKVSEKPEIYEIKQKVKEAAESLKDAEEGLSAYLGQYKTMSKKNVIVDAEGVERQIKQKTSV